MRTLERNKQTVYYANLLRATPIVDEYGNETGQVRTQYTKPVELKISVSAARGETYLRQFGESLEYDRVLISSDLDLPITESSVLWIDQLDLTKPHDYVVKKVARSLNSVSYAVSRVSVSG